MAIIFSRIAEYSAAFSQPSVVRVRKGPSNGAVEQPAKKLVAGVESTAPVRAIKA
jgi:hypothetical protein